MKKQNIVIMGAGPAGLTAAYYLLSNSKNKYNVIIIEKEKQVGGISKTISFNGYKMDTGIHRFFTKNSEVDKIWHELLPTQGKPAYDQLLLNEEVKSSEGVDPEKDNCLLIKRRITRILYDGKFYDYPVNIGFTTIKNMGFITVIKAVFSYLKTTIKKLPETSLENYYINRFGKVLYSMFFESYTEKVWGIHPKEISADWGSQRVKGISIKEVIKDFFRKKFHRKNKANTETSLIEQFIYPKLGSGNIYEIMADKIEKMGGKIIYNTTIKSIEVKNKKIVELSTNKEKLPVDILISSIPIKELMHLFNSGVSKEMIKITDDLPYREFMSVGLVVDKFNLENKTPYKTLMNIVPDSWIYVQEKSVKMGRIQIFNNWSPYMFKKKEDVKDKVMFSLEYFCSKGDKYWNMRDKEFIDFAIQEAEKLGIIKKENVLSSVRIKIDKAYPAYFGSYKDIDKVVDYLNSYKNLYCIGRNGQHRYNNMDHSMLTGIETAKSIINNSSDRKPIWNVNTEKDYHEEK